VIYTLRGRANSLAGAHGLSRGPFVGAWEG
jgi:hypothetical protein